MMSGLFRAHRRDWRCLLCGAHNVTSGPVEREGDVCTGCHATWRARAMGLGVLIGLGYPPQSLPDVEPDWSRRGIGVSDDIVLASRLAGRFDYCNTFYDRFPRLDLLQPPEDLRGEVEFVVCSDVLEHVSAPAAAAFDGIRRMLRPGGFAVLSVPVDVAAEETVEFYPGVRAWRVLPGDAGEPSVHWEDATGEQHVDPAPEFHGGRGQTLAFRRFSLSGLRRAVQAAGFGGVQALPDAQALGVPSMDAGGVVVARA